MRHEAKPYSFPAVAALAAAVLLLLPPVLPSDASAQTIQGRLLDAESGRPIDLGLVILLTEAGDSVTSTVTNEEGRFRVSAPDAGSFALLASAWGYRETLDGVFDLGEDGRMTVDFRIAPRPMPLDELVVSLNRPVLDHALVRNGFVRRAQRGLGHFITPADIEESPARETEALLERIPGVWVQTPRSQGGMPVSHLGEQVLLRSPTGGLCTPSVFVDGVKVQYDVLDGLSLSTLAPLATIEAVEVYRRPAEVPLEYGMTQRGAGGGSSGPQGVCGVILFWTRGR